MANKVFLTKAIMGGGKSFASIKYITQELGERVIIAVPKIDLAKEIEQGFLKHPHSDLFEFTWGAKGNDTVLNPDNPKDYQTARNMVDNNGSLGNRAHIITSDNCDNVQTAILQTLNALEHEVLPIIITHKSLYNIALNDQVLKLLKDWSLIIDEDPAPLTAHIYSDKNNRTKELIQLSKEINTTTDGVEEFNALETLDSTLEKEITKLLSDKRFKGEEKSYMEFLVNGFDKKTYIKKCKDRINWYGIEFLPLDKLISSVKEAHILAGRLTGLTKLFLNYKDIGIDEASTPIKPRDTNYSKSVQKKVSIYWLWSEGNHTLDRIDKYGVDKLKDRLVGFVGGKYFISRSTTKYNQTFNFLKNHIGVLPKVTNGLNNYTDQNILIDISCFNKSNEFTPFLSTMDELFSLKKGEFKGLVNEYENLELSAQAASRLGFRLMGDAPHDQYTIVFGDKQRADYFKKHYMPKANYHGAVITNEINSEPKQRGPKKGVTYSGIEERFAEAYRLVTEEDFTKKRACSTVNIDPKTYRKYEEKLP